MTGFLSKLGFSFHKVNSNKKANKEKEALEIEDPELLAIKQKRKSLYENDAIEVATTYASWIKPETLKTLCDKHNFMHPHWGSRKIGRLINICRNTLDVSILEGESSLFEKDRFPVLKLLFWMSILYPITIMWTLKVDNIKTHFEEEFSQILKDEGLIEQEVELVLHAVFNNTLTEAGNAVLDIWHDALKLEEMQFKFAYIPEAMRTSLGKNAVFAAKAKRDCLSNLSPHWLITFQTLLNEERFTSADLLNARDQEHEDNVIT